MLILTKADSISGIEQFNIGYEYKVNEQYFDKFNREEAFLRKAIPIYQQYDGYNGNIGEIRDYDKLPSSLKKSIEDFERFVNGHVLMISTGAEREQTIFK